jgi:hypothetical protein
MSKLYHSYVKEVDRLIVQVNSRIQERVEDLENDVLNIMNDPLAREMEGYRNGLAYSKVLLEKVKTLYKPGYTKQRKKLEERGKGLVIRE